MSRHLERLLRIDHLLRSEKRQTATSLADTLEVSERTVRKDLDFLRDRYHAPIAFSKSKGFHYTDPQWRLPTIPLTRGELFALTMGARMLEAYAGSAYATDLQSAITRRSERLPEQVWVDLQQLAEERILFRGGAEIDLGMVVRGLNDLKRWVLGYGKGAIVREPPELVAMVREEIGLMYYNYSNSSGENDAGN